MTKVKVKIEGHYEVEEIPYGKDYKWVPAHALIECDCGQAMDADAHAEGQGQRELVQKRT